MKDITKCVTHGFKKYKQDVYEENAVPCYVNNCSPLFKNFLSIRSQNGGVKCRF